ncbi:MAG: hypothetical protein JWL84_3762 [Rhodospirillales bacterium]|jgi:hypothetical protein|nr:hypothetical protein [Rhodospirillales bacterium]
MNRICLAARLLAFVAIVMSGGLFADARAADPSAFTVAGVPVDATAANAVAAREAARLDGERRAIAILMDRLTLAADHGRLPRVSDQALPNLVRDFEVAHERSSGVRYLAEYTFRFSPDGVRSLLRNAGVPFTETPSKPVVVLPVLNSSDRATLWDDPNSWRDAWANRKVPDGLVPLAVPLGDVEDVAAIDAGRATAADPAALTAIAARYDAGDALLAIATLQPTGELLVSLRRVAPGGAATAIGSPTTYKPDPGEAQDAMMQRAVAASAAAVSEAWKRDTMVDTSRQGTLTAQVPVSQLGDWIAVRNGLTGIPSITGTELVSLAKDGASVTLHYLGDPDRLRVALAQHDLALSGGEGSWTLQRQSAGTVR